MKTREIASNAPPALRNRGCPSQTTPIINPMIGSRAVRKITKPKDGGFRGLSLCACAARSSDFTARVTSIQLLGVLAAVSKFLDCRMANAMMSSTISIRLLMDRQCGITGIFLWAGFECSPEWFQINVIQPDYSPIGIAHLCFAPPLSERQ